jgi:hypothetical protein
VNYDDKTTGGHMPREGFPDAEFAILTDDTFTADVVGPRDPSIPQGKAAAPSSESSSTTALAVGALVVGLVAIAIATAGMYFILI